MLRRSEAPDTAETPPSLQVSQTQTQTKTNRENQTGGRLGFWTRSTSMQFEGPPLLIVHPSHVTAEFEAEKGLDGALSDFDAAPVFSIPISLLPMDLPDIRRLRS